MLPHVLLSLLVFELGFIPIRLVSFEFFTRYHFYKILHDIFSEIFSRYLLHLLYWWETLRDEFWILKKKYFMKVFHISWNDPETVFHEMPWMKNFRVYPPLKWLCKHMKKVRSRANLVFQWIFVLNSVKRKFFHVSIVKKKLA